MKSNLIKDTTKEERIALIKAWIPDDDGLQDCDMDLWDIYAVYINGKGEIADQCADDRYILYRRRSKSLRKRRYYKIYQKLTWR